MTSSNSESPNAPQESAQAVDLLIHSAAQLVTCASPHGPKRGDALADVGLIVDGAVAISDGLIVDVGDSARLQGKYRATQEIDASGKAVCPGFVDCHTHTVFGGDRAHEFEQRIAGVSYLEILAGGGGIVSTMHKTRHASLDVLVATGSRRLDEMLRLGTTTVEIKSGYGLDIPSEIKMLRAMEQIDRDHPCDIVPTFLGAHAVPPEFSGDAEAYSRFVADEMWPEIVEWYRSSRFFQREVPLFVDVFCEKHAFSVAQSERVLLAGLDSGHGAKIHVDQFHAMGGVAMAVGLGAASVDHLDVSGRHEFNLVADSDTVAVPLPVASFNLATGRYADARVMVESGCAVALATDLNPGSAPCPSMPMAMAIACRYQRLLPSEALNASTINAAYAVGLGDKIGSIEAGKRGDVLILKGGDYRYLAYYFGGNPVEAIVKDGMPVI
ncbi:MAG: imidazolonepropionase [Caldilineaceae bacterium]